MPRELFDETYTSDFSIGGISFETIVSIPIPTPLRFKIQISDHLAPIEFIGIVARSERKKKQVRFITGIRIVQVEDEPWERLMDWALKHRTVLKAVD